MQQQMNDAVQSYRNGFPVVVFDQEGNLLHGRETLEFIVKSGVSLKTTNVFGVSRSEFEGSDWPEVLDAHRLVFYNWTT